MEAKKRKKLLRDGPARHAVARKELGMSKERVEEIVEYGKAVGCSYATELSRPERTVLRIWQASGSFERAGDWGRYVGLRSAGVASRPRIVRRSA